MRGRSVKTSAAGAAALALGLFGAVAYATEPEAARSLYPELQFAPVESADVPLQTVFTGMVQDRDGFLWFATLAGLLRFDGLQARQWPFPPDESGQGGPTHGQLTEAADGTLWLLSPQGPLRLPPGRGGFERVPMPEPDAARWLWRLQAGGDAVWLANSAGGVYRYDAAESRFVAVFQAPGGPGSTNLQPDAHVDAEGALWLVHAKQIWRVTLTGAQRLYGKDSEQTVTRSALDPARGLICTPWPERLNCVDAKGRLMTSAPLPKAACSYVLFDPQGRLLLNCGRDVYLLAADGSALRRVPLAVPVDDAVELWHMAVDSLGTVWLAGKQGLRLIDPDTGASRLLVV